jgi:hypothetical protein
MRKTTIRSLTKKGYSQKKIAKILGIRKMKVVTAQKALGIGKRVKEGGAIEFWRDVKAIKETFEISRERAIKKVKYGAKWFKKRQAKLTGIAKAKDAMREKWHKIKEGEIEKDYWETEEGEDMIEHAGYQ